MTSTLLKKVGSLCIGLAVLGNAELGWAQGSPGIAASPTAEREAQAEELGSRGMEAYEAGAFDKAAADFEKAYTMTHWPTAGLWLGRSWLKGNRRSEAYAIIATVAASRATRTDEPEPFSKARAEASELVRTLQAELGVFVVIGGGQNLEVRANGTPVRVSATGEFALEPGAYHLATKAGAGTSEQDIESVAGRRQQLQLVAGGASPAPPTASTAPRQTTAVAGPQTSGAPVAGNPNGSAAVIGLGDNLEGWTLHNPSGAPTCQLPCTWPAPGETGWTLKDRAGAAVILNAQTKLLTRGAVEGTLMPARGSRGLALGVGIPAVIVGVGLLALSAPEDPTWGYDDYGQWVEQDPGKPSRPGLAAAGVVSLLVSGAAVFYYFWSKPAPYLEFQNVRPKAAARGSSLRFVALGEQVGMELSF